MSEIAALHVCLVAPPGYLHSDALLDPALYLAHQLARFGGDVSIDRNRLRHDAVNIVFGAHNGFDEKWCARYSCLFVNLEQLAAGGARVPAAYLKLLRSAAVIDYDASNPPAYTDRPEDVPLMSFGHASHLAPAPEEALPLGQRSIDVLFFGSMNARRQALIARIEATGRRVTVAPSPLYGAERDALIRAAKVVVNMPYYESALFEQVRAFLCQSLGTPVLSERLASTRVPPQWEPCISWFDADSLETAFGPAFDSREFQAQLNRQLTCFEALDPTGSHADIAVFATGMWKVHSTMAIGQTREDAWLYGPPDSLGTDRKPAPLFQYLDEATARIRHCIAQDHQEKALRLLVQAVSQHFCLPGVNHHGLYYPELDDCVTALAHARPPLPARPPRGEGVTLFIASELYQVGGHTKVLLDMARAVKRPVVVLTDVFDRYGGDLNNAPWIESMFAGIQVLCLPDGPLTGKVNNLARLAAALPVGQIVYMQHHQDPVAFVGTLAHPCARKVFIHHADHNPSLGCTLTGVRHADLSAYTQSLCSTHLGGPAALVPMHVPDQGCRASRRVSGSTYSVVTSGRPGKFTREGPFALHQLIATTLKAMAGSFYFIGPLDEEWTTSIRVHLREAGLDDRRFVPLGLVPSLWATLRSLDVDVYLGSAPIGGGRAAIEAQGAGLPVVIFKGYEAGSLTENYSVYASPELGWSTLEELSALLSTLGERVMSLARQARDHYDQHYSADAFKRALADLLGADAVRSAAKPEAPARSPSKARPQAARHAAKSSARR